MFDVGGWECGRATRARLLISVQLHLSRARLLHLGSSDYASCCCPIAPAKEANVAVNCQLDTTELPLDSRRLLLLCAFAAATWSGGAAESGGELVLLRETGEGANVSPLRLSFIAISEARAVHTVIHSHNCLLRLRCRNTRQSRQLRALIAETLTLAQSQLPSAFSLRKGKALQDIDFCEHVRSCCHETIRSNTLGCLVATGF